MEGGARRMSQGEAFQRATSSAMYSPSSWIYSIINPTSKISKESLPLFPTGCSSAAFSWGRQEKCRFLLPSGPSSFTRVQKSRCCYYSHTRFFFSLISLLLHKYSLRAYCGLDTALGPGNWQWIHKCPCAPETYK